MELWLAGNFEIGAFSVPIMYYAPCKIMEKHCIPTTWTRNSICMTAFPKGLSLLF